MTRVVSSVSHWWVQGSQVTDHTQDGLTAGYQLALRGRDAKDSRAGRVSGASRRTVSSHTPSRSCPRLSSRHLNYRQSRTRGHTGSVSVLVTCSLYSQSYGGYLKIAICVQFRPLRTLHPIIITVTMTIHFNILISISFNHMYISRSLLDDISSEKSVQLTNTLSFWRFFILEKATKI